MKDLNFFSSYSKKSDKKAFDKSALLQVMLILIIIGIAAYGIYNYLYIKRLGNDVALKQYELKTSLENPKIKKVLDREEEVKVLKGDIEKLKALDKYVSNKDFINEILLEDIRESIPSLLFIDTISISQDNVKIEGKSKDKKSIAQFEHNLKSNKKFDKVFISKIIDNENHYNFYLDLDFKEGEEDESNAENQ